MTEVNYMVDLETLGVDADAAVLQVGACTFDPEAGTIGSETFEMNVRLDDPDQGRIDPRTLLWWEGQDPVVRARVWQQASAVSLSGTLLALSEWMRRQNVAGNPVRVWAHAPTFDCAILRACYKRCGDMRVPWSFRDERCFRTLVDICGEERKTSPTHSALEDATAQALDACWMLRMCEEGQHP